jgi:transposase-like protein
MSRQYQKYSVEFREQAVRRVIDGPRPVIDVAKEINVNEGTLSNWGCFAFQGGMRLSSSSRLGLPA